MATAAVEQPSPGLGNGHTHSPTGKSRDRNDNMPTIDTSLSRGNTTLPSPSPTPSPSSAHLPPLQTVPEHGAPSPPTDSAMNGHDDSRSVAVTDSTVSSPVISESGRKARSQSMSKMGSQDGSVRKLSAGQMQQLLSAPESLPIGAAPECAPAPDPSHSKDGHISKIEEKQEQQQPQQPQQPDHIFPSLVARPDPHNYRQQTEFPLMPNTTLNIAMSTGMGASPDGDGRNKRLHKSRTLSTPPINRQGPDKEEANTIKSPRRNSFQPAASRPAPLNLDNPGARPGTTPTLPLPLSRADAKDPLQSPIQSSLPLPPMSLPTHLQLELSGQRPSPLYIYQTHATDVPYESSAVKFERLKNVLLLPPALERTLVFGALACLDAWLSTFTILPIRFFMALGVLVKWWGYMLWMEIKWVVAFVYLGLGRMWRRGRRGRSLSALSKNMRADAYGNGSESERSESRARSKSSVNAAALPVGADMPRDSHPVARRESATTGNTRVHRPDASKRRRGGAFRHRRTKSMPSNLSTFHKADLLQGAVIIFSSIFLAYLDGSRMYHFIRGQSAMKLYVIFNLLEVLDRLLSSLGQDIFECLFSSETLSRNSFGRSKVLLPFGMFLLSLAYNITHTVALFFMVITLNVAVNSYNNALLTLLLSNQFVEIKGAVFKKFEKENLFQLTCADIVERFQLWLFLVIIGMRNIVEIGALSVPGAGSEGDPDGTTTAPMHSPSILPFSFTILPSWMLSGEVLSPFLIVIGSEMCVDWIKHAYITKFNNAKPSLYGRMLDILTKDYYSNAFVTTSTLMNRLGLPLIPLSCLFIRASVQTYHMFLAAHLPPPIPTSTQTALDMTLDATPSSLAMKDSLERIDKVIRNALGRSIYGADPLMGATGEMGGEEGSSSGKPWWYTVPSSDDMIAALTMVVVFFIVFLVLLIVKLLVGMVLLRYSRDRFGKMKRKEVQLEPPEPGSRGVGGGGRVEKGEKGETENEKEREGYETKGRRVGGWGVVEVGEERRKIIYQDDAVGLRRLRDKEKEREKDKKILKGRGGEQDKFASTTRYEMTGKRIW